MPLFEQGHNGGYGSGVSWLAGRRRSLLVDSIHPPSKR